MKKKKKTLSHHVAKSIDQYFVDMEEIKVEKLYEKVICEVEKSMLAVIMKRVNNNQTEAANILGLNRNTLRKKLKMHGMLP